MIRGNVDLYVERRLLGGWVTAEEAPEDDTLVVSVLRADELLGTAVANLARGDGFHGFEVPVSVSIAADLLEGRIQVTAEGRAGERAPLNLYTRMLEGLRREKSSAAPPSPVSAARRSAPARPEQLAALLVPVGWESPDGSAVVGRDGYLFLYRGSNDVASLARESIHDAAVTARAAKWTEVLRSRAEALAAREMVYVQMVIPEKSTILADKAPNGLGGRTASLRKWEERIAEAPPSSVLRQRGSYRSLVPLLTEQYLCGAPPFLKTDSHLSERGALSVVMDVLSQIAEMAPYLGASTRAQIAALETIGFTASEERVFSGDLSERFMSAGLYELCPIMDVSSARLPSANITGEIVDAGNAKGHTGYHAVWRNPQAPIEAKALAFANSFFERGAAPRGLSWWFKHLFSEFHFCWSPELRLDLVDSIAPNIVICQTIERFLPVVPKC